MWFSLFYQPLINALVFLYQVLWQNLGLAIIILTVLIRVALTPLTLPGLKSSQKIKALQPELNALKKKYGSDKQAFAKKQLELFRSHGINPAAGCLPQIIQIVVLIALFQAFQDTLMVDGNIIDKLNKVLYLPLKLADSFQLNTRFLYLNLTKPDVVAIPPLKLFTFTLNKLPGPFLIAAALVQFFSSKLMMPVAKSAEQTAKTTNSSSDDLAGAMQTQMLYLFPVMTLFIGFSFPSGVILYWLTFSVIMLIQQVVYGRKN